MDDILIILGLLVFTALFTFAFIVLLKIYPPSIHKKHGIVVANLVENLRKIHPVGSKKGWKLSSVDYCSPRSWEKKYIFPGFETETMLYGSALVVKRPALVVMDVISNPINWDEWDSCYFSSSMSLSESDIPELRGDQYMKCFLVNNYTIHISENDALMYCFRNLSSDNVRWLLFWNIEYFDWWFFLIQPSMRKSDSHKCLLTLIRGNDSATYEEHLAKSVWSRIRNIKDAAEMHSFKAFPFTPVLEQYFSSDMGLKEGFNHCKLKSTTSACSKELFPDHQRFDESSPDIRLELFLSPGGDHVVFGKPGRFSLRLVNVHESTGTRHEEITKSKTHRTKTKQSTKKKRSVAVLSTEIEPRLSFHNQPHQEVKKDSILLNSANSKMNCNAASLEKPSAVNDVKGTNVISRTVSFGYTESRNSGATNSARKPNEDYAEALPKRSQSLIEFKQKNSGISLTSSAVKGTVDSHGTISEENELGPEPEVRNEKADAYVSQCSAVESVTAKTRFPEKNSSESRPDLSKSCKDSKKGIGDDVKTNLLHSSSSENSNCRGTCYPVCEECLEKDPESASDFEMLLPSLGTSEERITDLLTKGNYCAAELQAEVYAASQVKTVGNSERKSFGVKWMLLSSSKDAQVFTKTKEERSLKVLSYLCQTSLSISASKAWDLIRNPRLRFICDETAKKVTILEEFPDHQKIIYTYHEYGGFMKKEAMDFCLLHSERIEHLKYSLAYSSIEYSNCPLSSAIRGMLLPSGWVIEKVKGNAEECLVSYLIQVVVNRPDSMLVQESSNIVFQSIQNLKHYFTSAPELLNFN